MLIAERRSRILAHVRSQGYASFREIADVVGISESTVRRDLRAMAADGLVSATRGGVSRPGNAAEPAEWSRRRGYQEETGGWDRMEAYARDAWERTERP